MKQKITFKDFKNVEWKSTLLIGLLRSISAGIIWGILMFVLRGSSTSMPIYIPLVMPLLFPLVYYVFIMPVTSVLVPLGNSLSNIVGFSIVIISFILSITVCIGDPIIFILWKINKKIVPVDKFNFINLSTILFVMKEEKEKI